MQRSNLNFYSSLMLAGFLGLTAANFSSAAEAPKRLRSNIDESSTFALKGHVRPAVELGAAQDQGQVMSSLAMPRMSLHFSLSSAQQADMDQLLVSLQDRRSANYRKFLTPEQYAARFGMNSADLAKVATWLESNGFTNVQVARGKRFVSFDGTAGQVQTAFHTAIHKYSQDGVVTFANAGDPQLPKSLQGIALGVRGLHNSRVKPRVKLRPHFTSSITGSTFLTPDDWATIYDVKPLYGAGWDGSPISTAGTACGGSPCSIAVVGQSDVLAIDLAAFRAAAGLSAKTITVIYPPGLGAPGVQSTSGDEGESDLDLEWSNGIAKNANVAFVTSPYVQDAITYAVDQNVAPILSTSYGLCELDETTAEVNTENALFQQANAQGMTVVAASGDAGAADCDQKYPATQGLSVDFPASSPYVTGVGGTELTVANTTVGGYWSSGNNSSNGSAQMYIPEIVWNDSVTNAALDAGGGGKSIFFTKPSWQVGTGVPADGYRDVPDIALAASFNQDGLLICSDNWCVNGFRNSASNLDVIGGTSAGAPSFAGILALLVQKNGAPLGNINTNLYTLASAVPSAYHDITSGNNIVPCTTSTDCLNGSLGYSAGVGYDQASGWGSIDAYNMIEQWGADIAISASPTSATISAGSSTTANVTVGSIRGFSGTVTFGCSVSSALVGVTCSVPATTVSTSGSTTVTITAASTAGTPFWRKLPAVPPSGMGLILLGIVGSLTLLAMRKQKFVYAWGSAAALLLILGAVSCGGGSSSGGGGGTGHTSESGTVTVTATSGLIKNQVVIAVTVP